jgi:hypothetical protein
MKIKRDNQENGLKQTTPPAQPSGRAGMSAGGAGTKGTSQQKPTPPGTPYMNREMRRRMARMQAVKRTVGEEEQALQPVKPSFGQRTVQYVRKNAIWIITLVILVAIAIALTFHK